MDSITFTVKLADIMWGLGAIVLLGTAWKTITDHFPWFKRARQICALQDADKKTDQRINQLEENQKEAHEMNKVICYGVKCLLQNARTGNNKEEIVKCEKELDKFLINR